MNGRSVFEPLRIGVREFFYFVTKLRLGHAVVQITSDTRFSKSILPPTPSQHQQPKTTVHPVTPALSPLVAFVPVTSPSSSSNLTHGRSLLFASPPMLLKWYPLTLGLWPVPLGISAS